MAWVVILLWKIILMLSCCSNVLPADVDAGRDFFTESSPAAVRGMLASWPVDDCRAWCVCWGLLIVGFCGMVLLLVWHSDEACLPRMDVCRWGIAWVRCSALIE